jgi:hypothetical protein
LTPVFMHVDFGKVPNPFDFSALRPKTLEKQTRSSAKTTE